MPLNRQLLKIPKNSIANIIANDSKPSSDLVHYIGGCGEACHTAIESDLLLDPPRYLL